MALFGLFKSKQERDMEDMFRKMNAMIFPGGEADVRRDCQRIDVLVGGSIPQDKLKSVTAYQRVRLRSEIRQKFNGEIRGANFRRGSIFSICLP